MSEMTKARLDGLRALVVGGGIGGLTLAIALARRGARVKVLEQAEAIREVGAGIQVSPNGAVVLRALGQEEALVAAGAVRGRAVQLCDHQGREVTRLDLSALDGAYYQVHRADLIGVLESGARAAGVEIELGAEVADVRDGPAPVVTLSDGGERRADLVIGADGVHSRLRAVLNGADSPFFTGHVAWRAVIPNDLGLGPVSRVHMGPGRHVVSYPLRGESMINLVAVEERRGWVAESWSQRDEPDNLRAAFAEFGAPVQEMLERVETCHLWGLFRHEVAGTWHGESIVLLGDAVHPTLPFMAQGAVMAIEDAWVLADALARADGLRAGLADYRQRRFARVQRVVNTATDNAWKYHMKFPPLRFVAHNVLRLSGRIRPDMMLRRFDWLYRHDVTLG